MTISEHSENPYVKDLLREVKLEEVMSDHVVTIELEDSFSHVEEQMRQHMVRHLPVVNMTGKVVGIITERDLFRIQSPRVKPDGTQYYLKETLDKYILANCMTKNPFTLRQEETLDQAILAMAEKKYGCIPVVDDNGLLKGIMTQLDIIRAAAKILKGN